MSDKSVKMKLLFSWCFISFEMYSKAKKFFDPPALEYLFLKLNNEFGFDVEVENDNL